MDNYKVFGIHINNRKEDYAIAFRFIKNRMKKISSDIELKWVREHIFVTSLEININDMNIYRTIIEKYEQTYSNSKHILQMVSAQHSDVSAENAFFYFRVQSHGDDDIINLHNFFLGSRVCSKRCCLGIIADKDEMHFKISDYLFYEVYFSGENNKIKIISKFSQKTDKKYQFEIINKIPINVYLLSKNNELYTPKSIHKKGVHSSSTFFPQMKIDQNLYFAFSQNAKKFCQEILINETDNKFDLYSDDLLLKIALLNINNLPMQKQDIEKILNKPFNLNRKNIIEAILVHYCAKCVNSITSDRSSTNRRKLREQINKFLTSEGNNSTVLSICFFLSYLNRIDKTDRISTEWIDILTDSQDYASGTLQLIENVIKHVPGNEGIFCFRLHKCSADSEESANAKLITRYSIIDGKSEGFYIEILVSDYNEEFDIPRKFVDNIRKDLNQPENQREYYVSKVLLESVNNFKLKDLFDYHNNINTEQAWKDFYSRSQNLIAHYGLLVFEHLVKFARGAFHVFSSNDFTINEGQYYQGKETAVKGTLLHIPGTQYEILLPIGVSRTPLETGLVQEVDSNFTTSTSRIVLIEEHNYNSLLNDRIKNLLMNSNLSLKPRWKSDTANRISETIINAVYSELDEISPEETLFTFNVDRITDMTASEVFVKAFIQLVFSDKITAAKNFAFFNANEVFLTTFIRFFSILYLKSGQSRQMDGRLIYLCSSHLSDEVFFSGSSINNSLAITKRAVFDETGKVTHGLQILRREAEKADEPKQDNKYSYQSIQQIIRPFFKQRALKVLHSDIQQEEFGCCMHDTHMRIGSKIHINGNYYEASLLFGFSGYVSHFAENVTENIVKLLNESATANYKKLVIIGYETYSESLAIRIKENLKIKYNKHPEIDYIIYNESLPDTKFYRWNIVKPDKSTKFIVVVPVGSTLTTHDKVVADLLRTNFSENVHNKPALDSIIAHYVLILVRDKLENRQEKTKLSECEKLFWESVSENPDQDTDLVIEYRRDMSKIGADNKICCYLDVESNWYLPNKCPCCFPKQNNLILEKPLVLSNRSSVVPMTKIGINNSLNVVDKSTIINAMKTSITQDIENMMPLYDALCYGHIVRDGDNHFEYYFQTEKLMESLIKRKNNILNSKLKSWTKKYARPQSDKIIFFDYVVAPIHSTNANFVNCVSRCLNSKQIIWIDTKKDFRDNIIAKYSSLNSLYRNCRSQDYNVEIRFYYVDDTINSGDSFFRAKSLISSIFTELDDAESNVKVKVFHSVFLLLNRCSFNTQKNYVNDPKKCFHSIFDLNISYMRSYKDACVPCKNELNLSKTIPMCSSTSDIATMSLRKSQRYIEREAEKIDSTSQMIPFYSFKKEDADSNNVDKLRLRYYYRMVTSHRINTFLDNLNGAKNDKKMVEKYFQLQIEEICKLEDESQKLDLLISFLKVISRPFLSFRKSVNEAAMKVIITISEYVLLKNNSHAAEYANAIKYFESFLKRSENKILLVKVLFSCLTNLKSTFLLRSCTVKEVLELCNDLKDSDQANEFIKSYVFNVKSLLCLSEKNNLSFWLEYLTKEETLTELAIDNGYDNENNAVVRYNDYCYGNCIRNILKLENTSPILNALVQCHKEWERKHFEQSNQISAIKETLGHYYCRTYCEFNGIVKDEKSFDRHCENIFQPMLSMYHHLSKDGDILRDGNKETEYYKKLLDLVNQILDTAEAELLTKFSDNSAHSIFKGKNIFLLYSTHFTQQNNYQKTDLTQFLNKLSSPENSSSYICVGDTLYFEKNENNGRIGAVKIVNTSSQNEPSQQYEYYLVFKWNNSIGDMEIIHKARNLLTMRGMLMRRIVNDFENHLRNEFIMLRDRVKGLSIDRAGSHSPFEELKDIFLDTKQKIQESDMGNENEIYAKYLKLIADSVISKLYVHSIARTFPAHFHPNDFRIRDDGYDDIIPLAQYQKMFEILNKFGRCVADSGATKIPSQNSFIDKSLCKRRLISPKKCGYIWCCAFIALYYNALNHGYAEKNTNDEDEVTVEVSCKDNYICFRNREIDNKDKCKSERHLNRVTLEALQYYFDNYYGEKLFKISTENIGEAKYYTVMLPGLAKEEEGNNA